MKKTILRIASYILVAALSCTLTLALVSLGADTGKLGQLEDLILERYIGGAEAKILEDAAAEAMVTATGDRWSYYMSAEEYASYQERMANAYVGVGMTVQVLQEEGGFLILEVTSGGPAEEAGVQAGDVLVAVEDRDVTQMDTEQVRDLIRGEEGTSVNLTFRRAGGTLTLSVQRRQVKTPVATWEMLPGNVGLVTIENFDSRCAEESIAAIEALMDDGAQSLIFDVRNNPGGYAHELVKLLDYLLPEGELFRTVDYRGKETVDISDAACLRIPMAVLVNANSYSAAEFFAAALQDYDAAVVVGEHTSGKGYFQTTIRLQDGSAVSLSVGRYFTPTGESLAGVGITPDVPVQVDEETMLAIYAGTLEIQEDPQLMAALDLLQ